MKKSIQRPRGTATPAGIGVLAALLAALLAASQVAGATLLPMDLGDLCLRADRIFRGTVLQVKAGTVTAGGGEIPTVHYLIEVAEPFKGAFAADGGGTVVEIVMLGKRKPVRAGGYELRSPLPDLPRLQAGETYLLFTTAPGPAGLSAPVGLGQGAFHLTGKPGMETAVNGFGNRNLSFAGAGSRLQSGGPLPYADLAERIRRELRSAAGEER